MQKPYLIEQVTLRESIAVNLGSLEKVLNKYYKKGDQLHTITTARVFKTVI